MHPFSCTTNPSHAKNKVLYGALKGIFLDCIALLVNYINTFRVKIKKLNFKGFFDPLFINQKNYYLLIFLLKLKALIYNTFLSDFKISKN